jgi:hypothetical protein
MLFIFIRSYFLVHRFYSLSVSGCVFDERWEFTHFILISSFFLSPFSHSLRVFFVFHNAEFKI